MSHPRNFPHRVSVEPIQVPQVIPNPAIVLGTATPHTLDRSRRFRALARVQPKLPDIIDETTQNFAHLAGTRDKQSVLEILLAVMEIFNEDDPNLRQRLIELAFEEVCAQLAIDRCVLEQAQKMLNRCCKDRCACFSL